VTSADVPTVRRGWTADDLSADGTRITFVQVARGMRFSGRSLVLVGLSPTMPYFDAHAPAALGHVSTGAFLDWWRGGDFVSAEVARPCVICLADPLRVPFGDAVVHLARPQVQGTGLAYAIELVEGALPESSGACVVYINATAPGQFRSA
jgi:hypothetical protein